jgi:maltose alpha-D-glucosyltransferase/alpha-amylase
VWSDTDTKYHGVPIIFVDTEMSNWAWDPISKQYYWHRFFSHQPDLNYDNPAVCEAMWQVMKFWLDMGVDGFRLDAVPYLVEQEGTRCENLPETHAIIKDYRRRIDLVYPNKMLLAEANQWPTDVIPYFGLGDEFHMAFHFPLMPRMFMAVKLEDRKPIIDIMEQTPPIPEICQWCLFLRNHDELTLEMVTEIERDYMYDTYATDKAMRINMGIRRRLAPMMENDRRRIELMNGLLLSMPGTPVIYYGDEIGMGDNIYLGDRNGVRTPMQWNGGWNGGFSAADPERLYSPVISNPVYGYQAVNVESQRRSEHSLLNWMKSLIQTRNLFQVFSRGSIEFLDPSNHRVLAYVRQLGGEKVLVVNNLSSSAQAVELNLQRYKGHIPIEMFGRNLFPRIGELPYLLTLGPYQFYWFRLRRI